MGQARVSGGRAVNTEAFRSRLKSLLPLVWGFALVLVTAFSLITLINPNFLHGEFLHPKYACRKYVTNLEPTSGAWFGVNLDWSTDSLSRYSKRLGFTPAVVVLFTQLPFGKDTNALNLAASQALKSDSALMLTIEPGLALKSITSQIARELAIRLASINRSGVPVFLRFAHEMNGSWYNWGQQPGAYIAAYRRVASQVHAIAPGTVMLWAVNYGGGYPFTGGRYAATPGSSDFKLLDTNHDGYLTYKDNPYTPYYPGDAYVDWVGLSLYHWGSHYPWGANETPEANSFSAMLHGTYIGTIGDQRYVPDFYAFSVAHHKPLSISETAAFYSPARVGDELAIKAVWWSQVFTALTSGELNNAKMVNWFEWNKYEAEVSEQVNWSVTREARVLSHFRSALPKDYLHFAGGFCKK
jgi:hypothetical protein